MSYDQEIKFLICDIYDTINLDYFDNLKNNIVDKLSVSVKETDFDESWRDLDAYIFTFKSGNSYIVDFEIQTLINSDNKINLCVEINFSKELYDLSELEKLKFTLKDILVDKAETCFWLEDDANRILSINLYEKINDAETKLRRFLYEVLFRNIGTNWWDDYKSNELFSKVIKREDCSLHFNKVSDYLSNLDIADYFAIKTLKPSILDSFSKSETKQLQNAIKELNALEIIGNKKKVNDKMKEITDKIQCGTKDDGVELSNYIYKYVDKKLDSELSKLMQYRNDVMHNKLLDMESVKKIENNINLIKKMLLEGINKLYEDIPSKESIELNKTLLKIMNENEKIVAIEQSGITKNTESSIIQCFNEKIVEPIHFSINELLYFNQFDININYIDSYKGTILEIKDKVDNIDIEVSYELSIIEDLGEDNVLELKLSSKKPELSKSYICNYHNADYEYDEDSTSYKPSSSSYFYGKGLEQIQDELKYLINNKIKNYVEYIKSLSYEIGKMRIDNPVYEIDCEFCGEPYICADEKLNKIGKCLNCGEYNNLTKCVCGEIIHSGEEYCEYCKNKMNEE